ncbi:hypothetical protein FE394_11190 [Xenorhabdus sp. Reich]|uniref:Uncharacterized protein n=1 Tax=Xenorhabdus littoralis TaxID=2582835 RepID=A0ABU4SM87_9GAMM|nr:hypothetical protein [Xenorhabdus sp. Reich]
MFCLIETEAPNASIEYTLWHKDNLNKYSDQDVDVVATIAYFTADNFLFLAFLPQFTTNSENITPIPFQLFYLGLIFVVISFLVFTLISYLSGFLSVVLSDTPSIQTVLNKITGLIFIALAINLAVSQF